MTSGKVLILSDDEEISKKADQALREAGYQVCSFTDPWVALRYLRIEQSWVLVVDHDLQSMELRDFFARATKAAPNALRILLTDYESLHEPLLELSPFNIFRYLPKPCYESSLIKAVGTAVELLMLKASFKPRAKLSQFEIQFTAEHRI